MAHKGLVHWLYRAQGPEEADEAKYLRGEKRPRRPRQAPRSDLVVGIGILLVGMLGWEWGGLMVPRCKYGQA